MRQILIITLFSLLTRMSIAQTTKDSFYYKKIAEPGVKFVPVYGGKYNVFTQKVGNGKIKLLLLHGGPASTHESMEHFPAHFDPKEVTLYFYDQLGSYHSDQPQDSSIWDINRFVDEVEEVRKGLGLQGFYILGHSWGAQLAPLYAAKYPMHLKGIILSNPPAGTKDTAKANAAGREYFTFWRAAIKDRPGLRELSMERYDSVMRGIPFGDSLQFARLVQLAIKGRDSLLNSFSYRLPGELPEPVRRGRLHRNRKDLTVTFDQQLKTYDYSATRMKVKCPVLLIGGTDDKRMDPQFYPEIKSEFSSAKVRLYMCQNSGHLSMWDDTENYFREVKRFIREVENKTFDPEK